MVQPNIPANFKPKRKIQPSWCIYLLIYTFFSFSELSSMLPPEGFLYNYFTILVAFNFFTFPLAFFHAFRILTDILCIIPITLFIFRFEPKHTRLWRWAFIIKCASELTGHSGDIVFMKAVFRSDLYSFCLYLAFYILLMLPSYSVLFRFAFPKIKNKLLY